ncbi:MAG: AI-2E family transporter [Candidatus Methanoperedens sp.]|nr:AI-2E family transporter [Candidatus Methanoperedens sp.]
MKEPEDQTRFVILAGIVVISVILLLVYLSWAFVNIIILSLFGAYILSPLEKWLKKITRINDHRITAALTIGIVVLVFFAILTNIIFVISHELSGLTQNMQTDTNGIIDFWMSLLNDYIPVSMQSALKERFSSSVDDAILFVIDLARGTVMDFISKLAFFAMGFIVILFLVYYLLIDGKNILQTFIEIIPENRVDLIKEFMHHLDNIYNSLFNVYLLVSFLTGIIGAIGLLLIGVQYPVMWGSVIAILALLPVVGPGTFYIPAAIYYFLVNDPVRAIILLVFGWLFLETIPGNIIRPRLMKQIGNIHPIITLLSFTAPLFMIGPMGIIIGPAVFGFVLAIYRTYTGYIKPDLLTNK